MRFPTNGDYESLVEQITDVIVARLNGDGGEQAAAHGCLLSAIAVQTGEDSSR